jgi:protein tyrosine phosphatase (PTP) superfamily phosphohydrolase (DUF442 family)
MTPTMRLWPFALLALGCNGDPSPPPPAPLAEKLEVPGIENVFRVTPDLISGGAPEGDAAMEELKKLGVKTVISVDGLAPDTLAAEKAGLKYIHFPVGYDGINTQTAYKLAKAVQTQPGPVYVHCHHGKHRGPAALAAVRLCLEPDYTPGMARAWLEQAGTDPKYAGLFKVPTTLPRPTPEQLAAIPAEFPSRSPVGGLTKAMVNVDLHFDSLKRSKTKDWLGAEPAAALLAEDYREARRSPQGVSRGQEFTKLLEEAEQTAAEIGVQVKAGKFAEADVAFLKSQSLCAKCHAKFRD